MKVVVKICHPLLDDDCCWPKEKSQETKKEAAANHREEEKRYNRAKNTKIGLKMIGADFSFQTSHFFVQEFNLKFARCLPGKKLREEHLVQKAKHPEKKMFGGCFSVNTPGALIPVESIMSSKVYQPVIERRTSRSRELANLHPHAIFKQHSAPCHKAKIITNCLKKDENKSFGVARKFARFKPY